MMRAGQPLTGTNGRRCKEDEKLINATLRPGKRGYIIDTRNISVAQQAKARGGGFESEANYPQWRRIHKAIERCVTTEAERFASHFCPQRVDAVAVCCFSSTHCSKNNFPQNWNHWSLSRSNVLQESLIKLVEACNDQSHNMDRWLSKLEASSWQSHVKEILTTACLAAQCIDRSGRKCAHQSYRHMK